MIHFFNTLWAIWMAFYALKIVQCAIHFLTSDESDIFQYYYHFVVMYLDDSLIYIASLSETIGRICIIFHYLNVKYLCVKLKKCAFLQHYVDYLGYIVSACSIWTDPSKLEAIHKWPVPLFKKHVWWSFGLFNYYKKYVSAFVLLAAPLSSLCKGTVWC